MTCKMRKRHDLSHAAPEMSYDAVLLDIPFRGHFFVNEEAGFERATQAQPGEKCPADIILCESPGLQMSLRASGAPHSEFEIIMTASGSHTLV